VASAGAENVQAYELLQMSQIAQAVGSAVGHEGSGESGLRLMNVSLWRFAACFVTPVEARVCPVDGREVGVLRVRCRQVI